MIGRLIIAAFACALALPAFAGAQEQPKLDPDSPAGVEYQLPLDTARQEAAGGDGGDLGGGGAGGGDAAGGGSADDASASGSDGAPLFGSGIKPRIGNAGAEGARLDGTGADAGLAAGASTASSAATGIGTNEFLMPGIALGVLLVGAGFGLALRRGLRESPSA